MFEGSLEVKLPTIWTDEKQRWEESEKRREEKRREEKRRRRRREEKRRRREEERRSKKRKSQKKEDPGARKGRRVAKYCVFLMICGSGGSKSRLAKAAGAEPAGQMRDEKLHVVVARSTFLSQNGQNLELVMSKKRTPLWREAAKYMSKSKVQKNMGSEHFWTFRCRFAWQAQGIVHLVKSEQNVRILHHFQKRWQARNI